MSAKAVKPEEEFSLAIIAAVLADYSVPAATPDPAARWTSVYSQYSVGNPQKVGQCGTVTIAHTPGPVSRLAVVYEHSWHVKRKETTGIRFGWSGSLSVPTAWEIESSGNDGVNELAGLAGKKSAVIRGNTLVMTTANGAHEYPAPAPATINWLMFDVIPRFGGKRIEPVRFTLIDRGDKVKPGITLSWRKSINVAVGEADLALRAYEMKGAGILPTVFWTDERGLLLFVVSGMEAYCLKEAS